MLMFQFDINGLGLVLKMTRFNYSKSTLSLRDRSFIHGALSDLKLLYRMFSFTYTPHESSFSL